MNIQKSAASRRLAPHMLFEVIAELVRTRRLLLSIGNLDHQIDDADDYKAEGKKLRVCNTHPASPLP